MDANEAYRQQILAAIARKQQQASTFGSSSSAAPNENRPPLQNQQFYPDDQQQYPPPPNLQLPYSRHPHPIPPAYDQSMEMPQPHNFQRPSTFATDAQLQHAYNMGRLRETHPAMNYQQPYSESPMNQPHPAAPYHPQQRRPLSLIEQEDYYGMQQHHQPNNPQRNGSYGYFDRSCGPSESRFSASSAPPEFSHASNFPRSAPAPRPYHQHQPTFDQYQQFPENFQPYGNQQPPYDDSVFIPEQPCTDERPGFGPHLHEPSRTQTAPPPSRPSSSRPPAAASQRPQRPLTPRQRSSSVVSSLIANTPDANQKKKIFTHEHDEPNSINNSKISTSKFQKILSAAPSPVGAQIEKNCSSVEGCVTKIVTQKDFFMAILDNESIVGPFTRENEFFGLFHPSSSFKIQSNNAERFKTFYDSCPDFAQWGSHINMLTLRGTLSTDTVMAMTTALTNLHHLRIAASYFSDPLDLHEWLHTLPSGLSTLFVDARPFEGSTFYDDTAKVCGWMKHEPIAGRSVTLYTANMCGPRPLHYLLQNNLQNFSQNNTLTIISSSPLYKPIHDILKQNGLTYGPTTTHPFYGDVYVSFNGIGDHFNVNIAFSRSKEHQ